MLIEIFEVKGGGEISTDLDVLILDAHRRQGGAVRIRKVDVFNKEQIKPHRDIIDIIKKSGIEALPVIKADGKIVTEQKLQALLRKR